MKKPVDLILTGTSFLNGKLQESSLIIESGKIAGVGSAPFLPPAREHLKVPGAWVLPGMVDAHVHCGSNPAEGFKRATQAAAAGGVTTLIDHPLDFPQGMKTVGDLEKKLSLLENRAFVDVALLGGLVNENLDEIAPLVKVGVCGFKILMHDTAPQRFSRMNDGSLYAALQRVAQTGLPAGVHAENDEIIKFLVHQAKMAGETAPLAHCRARPPVSEVEAVQRALALGLASGVRLHLYHLSVAQNYEWIRLYRAKGLRVTWESCPHYLLLGEDSMKKLGGYAKINPPLRAKGEQEALWRLLAQGQMDLVTSDHAPWQKEHKEKASIWDCASGSPGVQTLFPMIFSEGVRKGRISLERLVQVLAGNPARTFHLYPQKGNLYPGADADIIIVDPKRKWTLAREEMYSAANWSLFEGMTVEGRVLMTFSRGRKVYEEGEIIGEPQGRFVAPGDRDSKLENEKWKM